MTQSEFIERYGERWQALESLLESRRGDPGAGAASATDLPALHRQVCGHLALARSRGYTPRLLARLDTLVIRSHERLYRARPLLWPRVADYLAAGFARRVRAEWRAVGLATVLFVLPLLATTLAIRIAPETAYTVLDPAQAASLEEMYDPGAERIGRLPEREADSDVMMFGYYIYNNVSIDFRAFAGGLLVGLGSVFYLIYNGLHFGAALGHLGAVGLGGTLYPFVVGHGALELPALVLSGAAGLKLGRALLSPGRRTRVRALRGAARDGLGLLWGAAAMTTGAALLEAFWSSTAGVTSGTKYLVGALLWTAVAAYFALAGRSRAS